MWLPVEASLVGVAILSANGQTPGFPALHTICRREPRTRTWLRSQHAWSPGASGAECWSVTRPGTKDCLTGEGISLAVKQAAAAVSAIVDDTPARRMRAAVARITRDYRLITRGLALASTPRAARLPSCRCAPLLPGIPVRGEHPGV